VIASLRGVVAEKGEDGAVVEVSDVGYAVSLSPSTLSQLPPAGETVRLFIAESVAMYGGGVTLYGFLTAEERQIFNALRDHVPGTGAKKALEFLDKAVKSLPDFRRAVLEKDARALVSLFGFTAKSAEKVVAGLHEKIDALPASRAGAPVRASSALEDAVQGLVSLGYRDAAAREAAHGARGALGPQAASRDLIREALRRLSGR
jgi:Holliday junction DNA helicase RuvA